MSGDIRARLDAMQARAEAATEGPWEAYGTTVAAMTGPGDCRGCSGILSPAHEPSCYWSEVARAGDTDAAFVAAARSDLPALLAFARDVLDLADESRRTGKRLSALEVSDLAARHLGGEA